MLLLSALASCSVDLVAMQPFPCAVDGTCPRGFTCLGQGCVAYAAGVPCQVSDENDACGTGKDTALRCVRGVCARRCSFSQCSVGETCTKALGESYCLVTCDAPGGLCPTGTRCEPAWSEGDTLVCSSIPLGPSCDRVDLQTGCDLCTASSFNVPCADGGSCPLGASCGPAGCTCGPGTRATGACSAVACTGNGCVGDDWACEPIGSASCHLAPTARHRSCRCTDEGTKQLPCGSTQTCESACGLGCDVLTDSCSKSGWKARCSVVVLGGGTPPQTLCLPLRGSVAQDQPCALHRETDGGTRLGDDTCQAGLMCVEDRLGAPRCRRFCRRDSDCSMGTRCVQRHATSPPVALCEETGCAPAVEGCGAGRSCGLGLNRPASFVTRCKADGDAGVRAACTADEDCGVGLACVDGRCRRVCTTASGCDAGPCEPLPGGEAGLCR